MEINCQPERLDLSDAHARLARDRGVSTDHFHRRALGERRCDRLRWGVQMARRAWVRAEDVLNTRGVRRLPQPPARTPDALTWPSPPPASSRSNRSSRALPTRHAALAEIRRIYFKTTRQTIDHDLAHAIELLKGLPSEDDREKATVYMQGLAEMQRNWAKKKSKSGKVEKVENGRNGGRLAAVTLDGGEFAHPDAATSEMASSRRWSHPKTLGPWSGSH